VKHYIFSKTYITIDIKSRTFQLSQKQQTNKFVFKNCVQSPMSTGEEKRETEHKPHTTCVGA
jgi:hypothetical protein